MSEPLDVPLDRAKVRKGVFFILAIVIMVALYQVFAFNFMPGMQVVWRRGDLELLEDFEKKQLRLAVLVMLEEDADPEIPHQLPLFDDLEVRTELNRLRTKNMLLLIDPKNDEHREWLAQQPEGTKLPFLMLYVAGYDSPVIVSTIGQDPESMAKLLNDVRFRRYER